MEQSPTSPADDVAWLEVKMPRGFSRSVFGVALRRTAVAGCLLFTGTAAPAAAQDFVHADRPHKPLMNPVAGNEDRPILVLYIRWDDLDYPAGVDAATVANAFFGTGLPSTTFPSVGDYFRRLSLNRLYLFPAQESEGTYQDGVVQVTVPGTRASFFALSDSARNKRVLELADPYVDFSSFDADGNGALSPLELVVNVLEVAAPGVVMPNGCGIARGVDPLSRDGVSLGGLQVSMNNTATNLITIIHENAHAAMDLQDLYDAFDVRNFDLGAATCRLSDSTLFAPSAWHKMHWGWITPTVVTRDGYYEVGRADTTGDAFLLYDPVRGTDDYVLVENRRPTVGTYDRSLTDDGLIIWRVAEAAYRIGAFIGLVRPTPAAEAWDASDPLAPQRTMSTPWLDGAASNVSVRAIGARGDVMRAYFDVPGPGVLVDPYPLDVAGRVKVTAAGQNLIDVPLMNTGETGCDTFVVEAVQLPAGWTMAAGARILCAGESSFARVTVTPDANAAVGNYEIVIHGRSTTDAAVTSEAPLKVEVVLRSTKLVLDAFLASTTTGTTTTFTTRLSAEDDPRVGLAGVPVTFAVTGPQVALTFNATTDANGVATATTVLALPAGSYTVTITSERLRESAPALATIAFEVLTTAGTIERVADELAALISAATNPKIRNALAAALDDLIGNNDSTGGNGALQRLASSSATSALVKIRAATAHLALAESAGAGDLWRLEELLRRAAEGITAGTP
jgi:M6 family metalloprotease-like protein